jgi:hypothetical protein
MDLASHILSRRLFARHHSNIPTGRGHGYLPKIPCMLSAIECRYVRSKWHAIFISSPSNHRNKTRFQFDKSLTCTSICISQFHCSPFLLPHFFAKPTPPPSPASVLEGIPEFWEKANATGNPRNIGKISITPLLLIQPDYNSSQTSG